MAAKAIGRVRWDDPAVYGDLDRPPLRQSDLERMLGADAGALWHEVRVLAETASTNVVAADAARDGAEEGLVVVAEHQGAGRGRLGRAWVSPPRAGLTLSVLLRPQVRDPAEWGWLPLLAGVAVTRALREQADVHAELKWPNDVQIDGRKVAGILSESVGDDRGGVVVGIGLNVTTRADELPEGVEATSLALAGASTTDRSVVLRAVLRALGAAYDGWHVEPEPQRAAYREVCATLGRRVRLELPDGRSVTGTADAVDDTGRLVVAGIAYPAADVIHLRD
jgi:BirA family biotin operon repressor/biotin-[acetyl-CoA-carboxylase] ligase